MKLEGSLGPVITLEGKKKARYQGGKNTGI